MKWLVLVMLAACGGDTGPVIDFDAAPPPDVVPEPNCDVAVFGGDLATRCIAQWDCRVEGTVVVLCNPDIDPQTPSCLCYREGAEPLKVGVPSTCMDEAVWREFARTACGWSFL